MELRRVDGDITTTGLAGKGDVSTGEERTDELLVTIVDSGEVKCLLFGLALQEINVTEIHLINWSQLVFPKEIIHRVDFFYWSIHFLAFTISAPECQ
ncbi:hypothetical protein [Desulfovibrio inopinatus]|uniref:hypothetical protein n=1 Tax=Desulfovibrio inopinatus TaxID=102109 RepID=UPI0012EBD1BC|nr:hypothetical protein [Desulfovibrio inopinatus]